MNKGFTLSNLMMSTFLTKKNVEQRKSFSIEHTSTGFAKKSCSITNDFSMIKTCFSPRNTVCHAGKIF